jgi:hypothetical protein
MKIRKVFLLLAMLQFVFLTSCVEEYWPEVTKYENLLVVDGGITNLPPPYEVKISKSSPIDSAAYIPYGGCTLTIVADNGESEILTETSTGSYTTSTNGIHGITGVSYKLIVKTPEGKEYESVYEKLKTSVEIDSVYAEVEYHDNGDYNHPLAGYQFYLDTKEAAIDTNYYLWKLESTYHYQSDYYIRWYYTNRLYFFNPIDSLYNCWRTSSNRNIYTFNTSSLQGNQLEHFPLNYVNTQGRELTIKYSLLVKQFTISRQAWKYWSAIEEQNSEQGSLYSHQPYQIRGNLKSTDDDDEPVLGYFMVAAVHSKRVFVKRIDAPFYYSQCVFNEGWMKAYVDLGMGGPYSNPQYVVLVDGKRGVAHEDCVDCTQKGGTTVKPDFWED